MAVTTPPHRNAALPSARFAQKLAGRLARVALPTAAILAVVLSTLLTAGTVSSHAANRFALGTNQWECSTGDAGSGCAFSDLPVMPKAVANAVAVPAACPGSTDDCVYVLGGGRTVQAYDVSTSTWISSDTGGACANASVLACMPASMTGFGAAVDDCPGGSTDSCIYVIGGTNQSSTVAQTVQAYDPATNTWASSDAGGACANSAVLLCMPTARTGLGVAAGTCPGSEDQCIYAIAGLNAGSNAVGAVEAYDPDSNSWISSEAGGTCADAADLACMPTPRANFATSGGTCPDSDDWCLYTMGGYNGSVDRTVETYDPSTNTWISSDAGGSCANSAVLACLPTAAEDAGGSTGPCPGSTDTCLYVSGGYDGSKAVATNTAYDSVTNTWTSSDAGGQCANAATISCLPTARSGPGSAATACPVAADTCAYVLGGASNPSGAQPLNVMEIYNAGADAASSIYVSPTGNDHSSGTSSHPFRTLAHAQSVVRSMNQNMSRNINVILEHGTYRLSQPLQFGPQDSGTNGHDVVWKGAGGQTAIISGAQHITGWKLSDSTHNIWSAHVPNGLQTRQIYVNGMRATLAAGPAPVKLTRTSSGYKAASSTMAHWRNPSQIDFVYTAQLGLMVEPRCPVASIKGKNITMAEPCWDNSNKRLNNIVGFGTLGLPTYIENAYELLHQPGQFYLDGKKHTLYYIPRPGQNMHNADVEAPALEKLMEGSGSAGNPIHNISFDNLQFSYATWMQPSTPTGYSDMQDGYTITGSHGYNTEGLCQFAPHGTCPYGAWTKQPGNVQFSYDHNLSFNDDRFVHLGASGLNLDNGTQNATVAGSVFTDISGNGVEIGNVDLANATGTNQTTGVRVVDNHVYGVPVEYHGGVGILFGYAANSTVAHNQVNDVPYSGISMGWGGWPDKRKQPTTPNFSHDNTVSNNLVYNFMEVLSDGGGVYTQGVTGSSLSHGEDVAGNVIHDQLAWGRALQSDDGSTNITYEGNVLYNDNYDWGSNHVDYASHKGFDPQLIRNNYWQQGDASSSVKGVTETGNTLITGPSMVPASVLNNAGIESHYRSILSWKVAGANSPNEPSLVSTLYAFKGKALVTWHPSYASPNYPVTSYTVSSCHAGAVAEYPCKQPGPSVTISASDFNHQGYATVSGLSDGKAYTFTVTANSSHGSSTQSVPSPVVTPTGHHPSLPGKPKGVDALAGSHLVRMLFYAPASSAKQPVLGYVISAAKGPRVTVTGLRELIVTNNSGRAVEVVGGLTAGKSYKFSVAAITPAGVGPAAFASAVKPH